MFSFKILLTLVILQSQSTAIFTRVKLFSEENTIPAVKFQNQVEDPSYGDYGLARLNKDALKGYSRRSDCFRDVAGLIGRHCAELDMDEEKRVLAAISMTLCELATAKYHVPPMECNAFSVHEGAHSESDLQARVDARGDCVNALSRSAQFWSTYSGYLREVPQLCFTFQRENDVDNAKDIFRNISLDQELFLRMIIEREQANGIQNQKWTSSFDELTKLTDQLLSLSRQTQQTQLESLNAVEEIQRHGLETLNALSNSFAEFHIQAAKDQSLRVAKIDSSLQGLSEQHAQDLQLIVSQLAAELGSLVDQSFDHIHHRQEAILGDLATTAQEHWRVLYSEFSAMQDAMSHLSVSTTTVAASLESFSKRTTQEIHQAQLLISDSAHHLSGVLDDLARKTSDQMEVIDVAVVELREKLLPPREERSSWLSYESVVSERWWKGNLVKALGFLLRGAPLSIWINSPSLKILEIVWIVSFWLLQRSLSTITSLVVLCLSCRKFIRRLLASSSPRYLLSSYDQEKLVGGACNFPQQQHQAFDSIEACVPYEYTKSFTVPVLPSSQVRVTSGRLRPLSAFHATGRLKTSRIPDRLCNPAR